MKLDIRAQLLLAFGLVLLLTSAVTAYGLTQMNVLAGLTAQLYEHPFAVTRAALDAHLGIIQMQRSMQSVALATEGDQILAVHAQVDQQEQRVESDLNVVDQQILGDQGKALAADARQALLAWKPIRDQAILRSKLGDSVQAASITRDQGDRQVATIEARMVALEDYADTRAAGTYTGAEAAGSRALAVTAGALALAWLLCLVFAFVFACGIDAALDVLRRVAAKVAVGDLNRDMSEKEKDLVRHRQDEIGALGRDFTSMIKYIQGAAEAVREVARGNLAISVEAQSPKDELGTVLAEMLLGLRKLVGQIAESAAQVTQASEQLASAAAQSGEATGQVTSTIQQVAQGTAAQAGSTTEVTASIDDIARRVRDIAAGAETQAALVRDANEAVGRLQDNVEVANRAMEITASTARQVAGAARENAAIVENTARAWKPSPTAPPRWRAACGRWASARRRSARSWARSRISPTRPTCWP